jgi:hypothetical protein
MLIDGVSCLIPAMDCLAQIPFPENLLSHEALPASTRVGAAAWSPSLYNVAGSHGHKCAGGTPAHAFPPILQFGRKVTSFAEST